MTANVPHLDAEHHPDIDLLSDFVSGDDAPEVRAAIAAHLASCEACREAVRSLRGTVALLHDLPQFSPPVSFQLGPEHARTARSGGAAPEPTPIVRLLPLVRTLSVAAVLLFLVIGGGAFLSDRNQGSDSQPAMVADQAAPTPAGETGGGAGTFQESEDQSSDAEAPARSAAVPSQPGGVVDRGDSASADMNGPAPASSGQDAEATPPADRVGQGAPISSESVDTSDDGFPWLSTTIGLGAVAIVLVGLWIALARLSRQR